jgi:hypothetical protein
LPLDFFLTFLSFFKTAGLSHEPRRLGADDSVLSSVWSLQRRLLLSSHAVTKINTLSRDIRLLICVRRKTYFFDRLSTWLNETSLPVPASLLPQVHL